MIAFLMALWTFLDGKKTYIVALLMAASGIYQALVAKDYATAIQLVLTALGFGSLRHAVAKNGIGA